MFSYSLGNVGETYPGTRMTTTKQEGQSQMVIHFSYTTFTEKYGCNSDDDNHHTSFLFVLSHSLIVRTASAFIVRYLAMTGLFDDKMRKIQSFCADNRRNDGGGGGGVSFTASSTTGRKLAAWYQQVPLCSQPLKSD